MRAFFVVVAFVAPLVLSQSCPPEDTYYYPDSQYCDRYRQCREGVQTEEQCPDGLLYNDLVETGRYPCDYPAEVHCGSRTKTQPPQPTENCQNQYGYFNSGSSSECGYFYTCVAGREYVFNCPAGLAFSSHSYRCEYADESPDCDAEAFLGFACPSEDDPNQVAATGFAMYRSSRDCREFFLCLNHSPRLQICDLGRVYNADTDACDEPENVNGCQNYYPADELKAIRERKAIEAERREQRRLSLESRRAELAKRRDG
uniref:Chondroitin proteoglycan-2-like n=1 Tax=Hirondellea gigas TaxID=1518452 RepID=A0A6A7FTW4_9CRUS